MSEGRSETSTSSSSLGVSVVSVSSVLFSFKAVDHDRVFAAVKNKLNEAKEDLEDSSDDVKDATEDEEKVDSNSGASEEEHKEEN